MNNNDNISQSQSSLPATGPWVAKEEAQMIRNVSLSRGRSATRPNRMNGSVRKFHEKVLFIGPSVEGSDKEYVKVLSGSVNDHKPSFA
ncbi:hypothetical protein D3C76_1415640 [compost metagenome]